MENNMTKAIKEFIPRNTDPKLQEILNNFSFHIDELVNFGSNIIKWETERVKIVDEDLPAVLFLRNFIEQIDAISVLVNSSSIEPCKTLLRTALENFFYLEYLFAKDTYERSMSFLLWNNINNNNYILRLNGKSDEYKKLLERFSKDEHLNGNTPTILPNADTLLEIGEKILLMPKYLPFKKEYERKKIKNWFSLFNGPKNIKELAESLGHHAMYDIFFRNFSASAHGTDIIQGKLIFNGTEELGILQIRDTKNAQDVTINCSNFCMMVYKTFINNRHPERMEEYNAFIKTVLSFRIQLYDKQFITTVI